MSWRRTAIAVLAWYVIGHGTSHAQSSAPAVDDAGAHYVHRIAPGDTLIALANQLMSDERLWPRIARLNRVREPRRLMPGRELRFPVDLLRGLPGHAEVLWVRGQPRIEAAGASVVALIGAPVQVGATITTADRESIRLRLSTGCEVTIGEATRLTLVELRTVAGSVRRTVVEVPRGRTEWTVDPATHPQQRHEVKTPRVNTTVRGTDFRVAVSDAATIAEVTDGTVVVQRDTQTAAVDRGFGVRVSGDDTALSPTPLPAAPDLGALATATTRLPVRARWTPTPGAAGYRVQVLPAAGGAPLSEQIVSDPDASWPDLADASYVLAVRVIDPRGLESVDATRPFIVDARPMPPLVRDAGTASPTYGETLTLRWTRPADVSAVDVEVSADATFESVVFARSGIDGTEIDVPLAPGRYAWRIASRQADERGPWSDAVAAELRARPAAGPPASAQVLSKDLTLQWSAGLTGDRYGVQVSSDPTFATLPLLVDTVVDAPLLTIPRPPPGRYHVRVRLLNAEGIDGPYGPTQSLDVVKPPRSKWWWLLVPAGAAGVLVGIR